MKAASLVLLGLVSVGAVAEEVVLVVPMHPAPLRWSPPVRATSSATLTPNGVYWTFDTARATTTLGPRGELYQTFRSPNATVTLLPRGELVWTMQGN